jgi:uncharacterized protein (TIGR03435 family)
MKLAGIILIAGACLVASEQAQGQAPRQAPSPTFDVASIKPAPPPSGRGMVMGMQGGPGNKDPELYRCNNCNIPMLIMKAYDIQHYQLSSPSWMDTVRFDISARVPVGATKEQFNLMLQNLLAERFKLAIHRDQKEMQVYDLVIAKGGLKIKESVEEPAKDEPADDTLPPPPPGGRGGRGPNVDKDGYPIIPKGCNGCIMVVGGGKARLHLEKDTMKGLAEMLASQLGKPVTDATGLKGKYDFDLTFDMEQMGMGRGGLAPPPGGGAASGAGGNSPLADSEFGVPILGAVQSQLGLRLEPKKGQVEMIVVDHAEKVPTEN